MASTPARWRAASSRRGGTRRRHDDDRAEDLASRHGREGGLDVVEPDARRHQTIESELAAAVALGEERDVTRREAVPVEGRFQMSARVEEARQAERQLRRWRGDADEHAEAARIARRHRLLERLGDPDALEGVRDAGAGELADPRDRVHGARVDDVGRPEVARPFELARDAVDRDDASGPRETRALDDAHADGPAPVHRDAAPRGDLRRIEGRADARPDRAADERRRLRRESPRNRDRLRRRDDGVRRERAEAEDAAERLAVRGAQPRLRGERLDAERLPAGGTEPAAPARRAPREDDGLPDRGTRDAFAEGVDDAGRLVAEQIRELRPKVAELGVEIGVTHAGREDPHEHFARPGWLYEDPLDRDRVAGSPDDRGTRFTRRRHRAAASASRKSGRTSFATRSIIASTLPCGYAPKLKYMMTSSMPAASTRLS